jgi:hypothetical protein
MKTSRHVFNKAVTWEGVLIKETILLLSKTRKCVYVNFCEAILSLAFRAEVLVDATGIAVILEDLSEDEDYIVAPLVVSQLSLATRATVVLSRKVVNFFFFPCFISNSVT